MLTCLAISKALAIYVGPGPSGLAVVGHIQNAVQLVLTAAKSALDTDVTKYTAEYSRDKERRLRLFCKLT